MRIHAVTSLCHEKLYLLTARLSLVRPVTLVPYAGAVTNDFKIEAQD